MADLSFFLFFFPCANFALNPVEGGFSNERATSRKDCFPFVFVRVGFVEARDGKNVIIVNGDRVEFEERIQRCQLWFCCGGGLNRSGF